MTEDDTFMRLKKIPFNDMLSIIQKWNKVWTTEDVLSGDYVILTEAKLRKHGWTYLEFRAEYIKDNY